VLEVRFYKEQKGDKKQENQKDPVAAAVVLAVQLFVFTVHDDSRRYERDEEQCGENELAL
jgi:hypothetical protein